MDRAYETQKLLFPLQGHISTCGASVRKIIFLKKIVFTELYLITRQIIPVRPGLNST